MTEAEFIAAVEATGATDVEVRREDFDWGTKRGVAVSLVRNGTRRRQAVRMPAKTANDDRAWACLLDWVRETA